MKYLVFLSLVSIITNVSCMTSRKEADLREQIWKLKNRVAHLEDRFVKRDALDTAIEKSHKDSKETFNKANSIIREAKSSIQYVRGEIEELQIKLDKKVSKRMVQLEREVSDLSSRIASKIDEIKSKVTDSGPKTKLSMTKVYKRARSKFQKKDYEGVVNKLKKFETLYKKYKSLDEVFYLRAESLYKLKKYRKAALDFNKILGSYSKSSFAPISKMRMGDCYRVLGDNETAEIYYKEFLEQYSKSKYRKDVKIRLSKLKKKMKKSNN